LSPANAFPQAADRLDASAPIYEDEILIRVDRLNLDSASFHQLKEAARGDLRAMAREIQHIVRARGKMHNPATNSGGTLLGTVEDVGPAAVKRGFQKGERIATLVSLTLTPLHLDALEGIDAETEQAAVRGHAILFESGIAHRLPPDFTEPMALAVFDVCGAPAWIPHLVKAGETVVVLGAGKAGVLAAAEARKKAGKGGHVLLLDKGADALAAARRLSFVDAVLEADLLDARHTLKIVTQATGARMADLAVNCVNVPGTEMATILAAKRSGTALFFNMATRFQAAVLGAEGIGHETRLLMGNGYFPGHADLALNLVRDFPDLREWFEARFGS
jgi:L-erythro-3,5-diaminohexanoate dehydrogenase